MIRVDERPQRLKSGIRRQGEMFDEHIYRMRQQSRHLAQLRTRRVEQHRKQEFLEDQAQGGSGDSLVYHCGELSYDAAMGEDGEVPPSSSNIREESSRTNQSVADRALYYAMYAQRFNPSAKQIQAMEELMEVIYGYPPPITYNQDVLPLNKRFLNENNRKINVDELPVENEQEIRGNVYIRPDSIQRSDSARNVVCLFDCISNHVLDMNMAARFIYEQKINNQFSQESYNEFVRSECADNALSFCYEGLDFLDDPVLESRLNNIAMRLMTEIHCAKVDKLIRLQQITNTTDPLVKRITISAENLTKQWFLDGPAPFMTVPLHEIILRHRPKENGSTLQMLMCMYRFMLTKITDPPDAIKTYSVRLNGRNGRCETLINLPSGVEATLLDFGEDLAGYGRNELKASAVLQLDSSSSFFLSLGDTPEQRTEALNELLREKAALRKELFKALQIALKDVRGSKYDPTTGQWIPSDRKAKRARIPPSNGEESLEPAYE